MYKIIHLISSLNRGGRERQLATIVKYDRENTNLIICINKTMDTYVTEYSLQGIVSYISSRNFINRIFEIRKIIKKEDPNIIWTWGGFETTFVFLIRLICYRHFKIVNGSIRHGIVKFNRKQIWRLFLLHLSKYRVANSYAGLKANRLRKGFVLYNGLDRNLINDSTKYSDADETIKKNLKINDSCIVLVSVANLVPYKDYYTVFKALKRLKQQNINFKYIIIGEGPMRKELEKRLQEYNLTNEVSLLGRQANVKMWLAISDIFIHSSKGEGFSNAILEAMANGLPVIATNTGGTGELVTSDVGFLFNYKDDNKLYDLLDKLIKDKELRISLGRNSAQIVTQKFSTIVMIKNYHNILKTILND